MLRRARKKAKTMDKLSQRVTMMLLLKKLNNSALWQRKKLANAKRKNKPSLSVKLRSRNASPRKRQSASSAKIKSVNKPNKPRSKLKRQPSAKRRPLNRNRT